MNHGGNYAERTRYSGGATERVDNVVCAIHEKDITETETFSNIKIPLLIMESGRGAAHGYAMLSSQELLALLDARGIKGVKIAECLDLSTAGVSRLMNGDRQLKLDEAKKLVERFNLVEDAPQFDPLTIPVARLLVLYTADYLGMRVDPEDRRVEELAQDIRAFSKFALDPEVRDNSAVVTGFLRGVGQARNPTA